MAAVSHPPLRASREADPRAPRVVSRKDKRKLTVRVPNPKAPVKGRLKTPPHKVHKSVKHYRRRSEEHTSELQSPCNLVCRLLLEKKKKNKRTNKTNIDRRCLQSSTTTPAAHDLD